MTFKGGGREKSDGQKSSSAYSASQRSLTGREKRNVFSSAHSFYRKPKEPYISALFLTSRMSRRSHSRFSDTRVADQDDLFEHFGSTSEVERVVDDELRLKRQGGK